MKAADMLATAVKLLKWKPRHTGWDTTHGCIMNGTSFAYCSECSPQREKHFQKVNAFLKAYEK